MLTGLPNIITTKPPQPKMNAPKTKSQEILNHILWIRRLKKREEFMCVLSGGKTSKQEWDRCQEILKTIKPNPCNQSIP